MLSRETTWQTGATGRVEGQGPRRPGEGPHRPLFLSILLLVHAEHRRGFGTEAAEVLIVRPILVHPRDGLGVPLASFVFVSQLPVRHGQEVEVVTTATRAEPDGLIELGDRAVPIARAVRGD